ncbi:MAG TPA: methyltransferase domain-containing protein [Streptosporangiaceae bacterium]|nr:methyltransferase domain-containing protein [Streptosporangiaceae bacterium]
MMAGTGGGHRQPSPAARHGWAAERGQRSEEWAVDGDYPVSSGAYRAGSGPGRGGGEPARPARARGRLPDPPGPCAYSAPWGRREGARTSVVWTVLREVLAERSAGTGRSRLDVVDAGGGTGGFAVPLAALGHNVTVVDPSPDSLAAAQRRAAEMNVPLGAIQGEAAGLDGLVGEGAADLVICHNVLEYVELPAEAMAAIARVLRPAGAVSVLAASAVGAVLHRALAGRFEEARALLGRTAGGAGGPAGGGTPRRFTLSGLSALIEEAGLHPGAAHGVRVFADLVPSTMVDAEPGAAAALCALEEAAASHPAFRDIAAHLHVLGRR